MVTHWISRSCLTEAKARSCSGSLQSEYVMKNILANYANQKYSPNGEINERILNNQHPCGLFYKSI